MTTAPETKAARFTRLCDQRLPRIIHALDLLGNLSRSGYEHTPAQADKLVAQLRAATDRVAAQFGRAVVTAPAHQAPAQATLFAAPAPDPAPTPSHAGAGIDRGTVMWAYEMLRRGDKAPGMIMLARALGVPQRDDPLRDDAQAQARAQGLPVNTISPDQSKDQINDQA